MVKATVMVFWLPFLSRDIDLRRPTASLGDSVALPHPRQRIHRYIDGLMPREPAGVGGPFQADADTHEHGCLPMVVFIVQIAFRPYP
jgi:hypothetical protein